MLAQLPTLITDMLGRVVVARSRIAQWQLDLMPQFIKEAAEFVRRCEEPFTLKDMADHARGLHWFSICGHDRNNKIVGPVAFLLHVPRQLPLQLFLKEQHTISNQHAPPKLNAGTRFKRKEKEQNRGKGGRGSGNSR